MNWKVRKRAIQCAVGLCAAMLFCSAPSLAQDVKYNYMPGTNFSKYHTYKWAQVPGGAHPDQILNAEIKQDIDNALALAVWDRLPAQRSATAHWSWISMMPHRRHRSGAGMQPRL